MEPNLHNPVANPVAVLREEFDEWAVLYNPDTAGAISINPVGIAVWKLMDGKHDVAAIAAEVKGRFEDVPETVQDDMVSFIHDLEEHGFVRYEARVLAQ